jgi:hypothetical protein
MIKLSIITILCIGTTFFIQSVDAAAAATVVESSSAATTTTTTISTSQRRRKTSGVAAGMTAALPSSRENVDENVRQRRQNRRNRRRLGQESGGIKLLKVFEVTVSNMLVFDRFLSLYIVLNFFFKFATLIAYWCKDVFNR